MSIFKSEDIKEIIDELEDDINYKIKEDDIKYVTKYSAIISESLVDSLLDALEKRGVKVTHVIIRKKNQTMNVHMVISLKKIITSILY